MACHSTSCLWVLGFGIYAAFSLAMLRFTSAWLALRRLLRRLYSHPSRYSYKNVQLAPRPSHLDQQKIPLHEARRPLAPSNLLGCVRAIFRIAGEAHRTAEEAKNNPSAVENKQLPSDLAEDIFTNPLLEPTLEKAEKQLEELWRTTDWRCSVITRKALYDTMAQLTGIVTSLFEPAWRLSAHTPPLQMVLSSDDDKLITDGKLRQQADFHRGQGRRFCPARISSPYQPGRVFGGGCTRDDARRERLSSFRRTTHSCGLAGRYS